MPLALHVRIAVPPGGEHVATVEPAAAQDGDVKIPGNTWQVFRRPDGVYECIGTLTGEGRFDAPPTLTTAGDTIEAILVVPERNDRPPHLTVTVRLVVHHLFATAWNEAVRAQLQERAD